MASRQAALKFEALFLLTLLLAACLVAVSSSESSPEKSTSKDDATAEDNSNSQEDNSKEKRSREEILFGNQQNKPSGLVDDLMGMSDSSTEEEEDDDEEKANEAKNAQLSLLSPKDSKEGTSDDETMTAASRDSWYNTVPVSSSALQYLANPPTLQSMPSEDFTNSLYDQEEVYRRKRQLLGHPLPLRRRRSLRSSLGQMIQKRGLRMPRRSMRLKRQVDVKEVLNALKNDYDYDDQSQVPGHFSSYPETRKPEYRYPFTFQHRDEGILGEYEDNKPELRLNDDENSVDDIDDLMLLNPNPRYIDSTDVAYPYRTREEDSKAFQKWLARYTVPNTFTVSRRSSPTFYPIDYRYIPGYKKRSIFSKGNRMSSSRFSDNDETSDAADLGKWGHVVQVPEAYASAEDIARLYGIANLMAEEEDEAKARRAA